MEVLTAIPNYPEGKFYKGYNFFNKHTEIIEGVKINRSRIIPRMGANKISLSLNYLSFIFFGIIRLFFLKGMFDRIFIFAPSPITVGLVGSIAAKKFKAKSILWVQDLWPESVEVAGKINNRLILKFISFLTKLTYNYCDLILVQSKYFIEHIVNQKIPINKIKYLPNYSSDSYLKKNNIQENIKNYFNEFTITFAGNIGAAQNLEILIKVAQKLKKKSEILKFVIIGSGRNLTNLKNKIKNNHVENYFHFVGRIDPEFISSYFKLSDVLFISLIKSKIFSLTIPSKLQTYLSYGKPIIGSIDGVSNEIINSSNSGYASNADDSEKLYKNIIKMKNLNKSELINMGKNASIYYKQNFSKDLIISRLIELIK